MSISSKISNFLAAYTSVENVLSSAVARKDMSAILVSLGVDPNTSCDSCVRGRYIYLQSIVNKNYQVMTEKPGYPRRRYVLPEGKKVRPFGSPIYYDNSTLSDEMILAFEKKYPGFMNNFVDTEELAEKQAEHEEKAKAAEPPQKKAKASKPPKEPQEEIIDYEQKDPQRYHSYMEGYNHAQLSERFKELAGEDPPGRPTKRILVFAIMKEEDALSKL